jgi:drug/metabolite transporter (DMT)-like permease
MVQRSFGGGSDARARAERERMTYGLLTAVAWGVSTLLAAVAARRIGALRTVVIGEAAGLVCYGLLFMLGHFSLRGIGGVAWLLVLAGVIGVAGYLAMYRGLESGHVGLVSAISACYGGVIVVLSVVLLREHLTLMAVVGIVATVAGVMIAVLRSGSAEPAAPVATPAVGPAAVPGADPTAVASVKAPAIGAVFGLIAALSYGVGGFLIGRYTIDLGWLVPVVVARGGAMVMLLGLLVTPLRKSAGARLTSGLAWAIAAGVFDAFGLVFFSRGDQVGLVAVTAAVSSAYPIIPLVGGLLLFRERLKRQQVGGAMLILAGLVLLGFGS